MTSKELNKNFAIKWGLIMGVVLSIIRNIKWLTNPEEAINKSGGFSVLGIVSFLLFIGALVFVAVTARNATGYITSKKAFNILATTVLVYGLLSFTVDAVITIVKQDELNTKMLELREETITKWEESGMSDEQIETALKWFEWMQPNVWLVLVFSIIRIGFNILIALIIAQLIKRNPPFDFNTETQST